MDRDAVFNYITTLPEEAERVAAYLWLNEFESVSLRPPTDDKVILASYNKMMDELRELRRNGVATAS